MAVEHTEIQGKDVNMWRNYLKILGSGLLLLTILVVAMIVMTPKRTSNVDAVSAANQLYNAGNLAEAVEIYEQLIAQGVDDSVVYYNLGNAYYELGDRGRAVTNYNRAAQLAPRDPDIKANLEIARSQIPEPFLENEAGFAGLLASFTDGWLTVNETALIALGLWFLAGFLLVSVRYVKGATIRTGLLFGAIGVILLVMLTGLSLGGRLYVGETKPEGVVVVPSIAVSSEPGDGFATDVRLSSGAEIRFAETNGNWGRLAIPGDSFQSWIPLGSVEMVALNVSPSPAVS